MKSATNSLSAGLLAVAALELCSAFLIMLVLKKDMSRGAGVPE